MEKPKIPGLRPPVLPPRKPAPPVVVQPAPKPAPIRKPKSLPKEVAPAPTGRPVPCPSMFRRQLAGVEMSRLGEGERRLDAICKANGWAWGLVHTYDKDGKAKAVVLIGSLFEGEAELGPNWSGGPLAAWKAGDAALGDLAAFLEQEYGGGDSE